MNKQSIQSSHITNPSFQNPRQSRLYMKQIQIKKKMSKIESRQQLQKIYKIMRNQNNQLVKDIKILREHLSLVQDRKKLNLSQIKIKNESTISINIDNEQIIDENNNNRSQSRVQIQKCKKQLQQQYKLMRYLKSNINVIRKQQGTQDIKQHKQSIKNRLKQLQVQKIKQVSRLRLLVKQRQHLQQTINNNLNKDNVNIQLISNYQKQNLQIRKKISIFKNEGYKNQYKAVNVLDEIYKKKSILTQYNTKSKQHSLTQYNHLLNKKLTISNNHKQQLKKKQIRQQQKEQARQQQVIVKRSKSVSNNILKTNKNSKQIKKNNILPISTISNNNINNNNYPQKQQNNELLTSQIIQLKNQINKLSFQQIKSKQQSKKYKSQLLSSAQQYNLQLSQLSKIKTKKISELNRLKSIINNLKKQNQSKHKLKFHTINIAIQQNEFDLSSISDPLRRDFAGIIGTKYRFDDRIYLGDKKRTFIKGLIIYQNENSLSIKGSIVAIRGIYTDKQVNELNHVPILGQYLSKCKTQRLQLPQDDFIKLIKVKYNNNQTRISKIQIRSNRNLKYQFGQKKSFQQINQYQTVYAFDIGLNQYPVSIFGSITHFRNCYYLQSFGVQINTLS